MQPTGHCKLGLTTTTAADGATAVGPIPGRQLLCTEYRTGRSGMCRQPSACTLISDFYGITNNFPKPAMAALCNASIPRSPIAARQLESVQLRRAGGSVGLMNCSL